jgi:hypothetical protein
MPHRGGPPTGATPPTGSIEGEALGPDEARALQAAVDAGHQPWRLDPTQVALAFVGARYGWSAARAVLRDPSTIEVTDPSVGAVVVLRLVQPVTRGTGGVWVVDGGVRER